MMAFELAALVAIYIGLSLTAIFALVRIVWGPTILDRMIASDVLLTTLILAVGSDMVLRQHTHTVALMIVIAATSVFATVTVARFVRRPATVHAHESAAATEFAAGSGSETPGVDGATRRGDADA